MGLTDAQMEELVRRSLPNKDTAPVQHEVYAALNAYKLALIRVGHKGIGHRFMCWIGGKEALAVAAAFDQVEQHAKDVVGKSPEHRFVLEQIVKSQPADIAKKDNLLSLLSGSLEG